MGSGRRGARPGEPRDQYLGRPGLGTLAVGFLLLALSMADAWATLRILSEGGSEANPFMRAVLALGTAPFIVVKMTLTVFGATVLCLHQGFTLGRAGLWITLGGYGALVAYHLAMQLVHLRIG
jgi:hypothetical protein